ncbi:MAG: DNA repair protein RecO [Oscillospiraceae bacterium]|jgi:DNA repair protein RecO (recombination protein O)|nr:DNA repair protein RecO [Oscillospiraceae bacterium]
MYINTKALVLRSVQYTDSGRILTVLTPGHGKLTVSARGATRKNSRVVACTQALAFSDMTLLQSRDRWSLTEAQSIELFAGLAEDITRLALGTYFAELLEAVGDVDAPSPELLSLGLNALHLLTTDSRPAELVKAAFETRLVALAGYLPRLETCDVCGNPEPAEPCLDLEGGSLLCKPCAGAANIARLDASSLQALRHVTSCAAKRVFSFTLGEASLKRLGAASEKYLLAQLDRRFGTLEYYHNILRI